MKKRLLLYSALLVGLFSMQGQSDRNHLKTYRVVNDSVRIDTVSISPFRFKVFSENDMVVEPHWYEVDFGQALLVFRPNAPTPNKVHIQYRSYPAFMTRTYQVFDPKRIVPYLHNDTQGYRLTAQKRPINTVPFKGLQTEGSILRNFGVGNQQNGVLAASMDLNISGKLSEKVRVKAAIVDTNLPIQENGNTYQLNEFDRVFVSLYHDDWTLDAGDVYLNNRESRFMNFNKKVSGLQFETRFKNKRGGRFDASVSGALVKGKYKKRQFRGVEGNQGPYQLSDLGEQYILILSGTEQIYVNGSPLKRGEEHDYTIDYNTAELSFNSTFPIRGSMRITAEFQYTDQSYNRLITYNHVGYQNEQWQLEGYYYHESDLKTQPLGQPLSSQQQEILAGAGNEPNAMVAPSAYEADYNEDKILYKKQVLGDTEVFVHTLEEGPGLYQVAFSYVGEGLGAYALQEVTALGNVYEYVGALAGNYQPVIRLTAPEKLQVGLFKMAYKPSEKTRILAETAISNKDANLFSSLDDTQNRGMAGKFHWDQVLVDQQWSLKSNLSLEFINRRFQSIERLQGLEFDRDWNLGTPLGDQALLKAGLNLSNTDKKQLHYTFERLSFDHAYTGNKHLLNGHYRDKKLSVQLHSSLLKHQSPMGSGRFVRNNLETTQHFSKSWGGLRWDLEQNKRQLSGNPGLQADSHAFKEYEAFFGIGDTTAVYLRLGAGIRLTDSVQNRQLTQVNQAKTLSLRTRLFKSANRELTAFAHYRKVSHALATETTSLNTNLQYRQQFFQGAIRLSTRYQSMSGSLPLHDFVYIKTAPGQGYYTWIDYNENGLKELNEFEIAQFADQADYLRTMLPTLRYLPVYQQQLSQSLSLSAHTWQTHKGLKRILSGFSNQTSLWIDSKQEKKGSGFPLNPFLNDQDQWLGGNFQLSNSLAFNRGEKRFSTSYLFNKSSLKNNNSLDLLKNTVRQHQLQFKHRMGQYWELQLLTEYSEHQQTSMHFSDRNHQLENRLLTPKIAYHYSKELSFSLAWDWTHKTNTAGNKEKLRRQQLVGALTLNKKSGYSLAVNVQVLNNHFSGPVNSPVAYQMMEGLQAGKNFTWSSRVHRKLNNYIHLSLDYSGRNSETSPAIHTGSVQLKALF